MSKTIKVRTSYTGCPYITAGKVYEAEVTETGGIMFVDNDGIWRFSLLYDAACLYGGSWEILPEDPSIADELAEALQNLKAAIGKTPVDISKPGWGAVVAELCEADVVLAKYKESKQ